VDVSKFKTSDWLKVGGGAVFFIAAFLTWWKVEITGFSDGANAFEWFFTGTLPWLIFTAIGVLAFLAAAGVFKLPPRVPVPLVFLAASALGLLLVFFRFLSDGVDDDAADIVGVDITRGIGLYLALLAAIAVLVGCVMGFKESGGDFNDLKDMNKLKAAFDHGSDGTPPPPGGSTPPFSGGSTPPPPPPPSSPPPPPPPAS